MKFYTTVRVTRLAELLNAQLLRSYANIDFVKHKTLYDVETSGRPMASGLVLRQRHVGVVVTLLTVKDDTVVVSSSVMAEERLGNG